jgi:hypothetical protein
VFIPLLLLPALSLYHRRNAAVPLLHPVMYRTKYLQPSARRFRIIDHVPIGMNPARLAVLPAVTATIVVDMIQVQTVYISDGAAGVDALNAPTADDLECLPLEDFVSGHAGCSAFFASANASSNMSVIASSSGCIG